MPAPATIAEFLDLVRKSGVVEDARLDAYAEKLRPEAPAGTPAKLAGAMMHDGLLTSFQSEQLLQGKWRRFTIGKYKVLDRLGSGGMGSVYLCEHKFMKRRVAVKVLPTAKAQDPASLERFYREARAVAALDHVNIVHAYDIDQDETLHFLVMEYVDGVSLQDLVRRSGTMEPARAAHYMRQAALGLEHAFERGLIHRDIKPGNLLVDRAGTLKILDMGLARFFNDEEDILTKKYDENVLGTADYLSPEQALDSHEVDLRADIYSLGATFYFLLTGRTPFGDGSVAQKLLWHQSRQPRSISQLRPELPAPLCAVVQKMMAKDPQDRYQTHGEVVEALAPWTQTPIAPPTEAELPRLSPAASGEATSRFSPHKGQVTPVPSARPKSNPPQATPLRTGGSRTPPPIPRVRRLPADDLPTMITANAKPRKSGKVALKPAPLPATSETAPLGSMATDTQSFESPATPARETKPQSGRRLQLPAQGDRWRFWLIILAGVATFFLLLFLSWRLF